MFKPRTVASVKLRPIELDWVDKLYTTKRWFRFRSWFLSRNIVCQRIVDGVQCHAFATEVHHRISPRTRPELFTDAENCVGLCRRHHHKSEGDRPDDRYVPTVTE
jgi:hypothetical protein